MNENQRMAGNVWMRNWKKKLDAMKITVDANRCWWVSKGEFNGKVRGVVQQVNYRCCKCKLTRGSNGFC
jgi:hypothetical protein